MNLKNKYFYLMLTGVIVIGCSDNEDQPKGQYEHGAIIVNEGGFGKSNGSITYYNTTTSTPEQNILQLNPAKFAGDVAQSITFSGDKGYVVLNGDNKIAVVDANTFKALSTISSEDIISPRYVQVVGDKAYITVWGPYNEDYSLADSYVLVYDLTNGITVKKIDTDEGTENLTSNGTYLFASNYNFGASSTVAVIDPADNSLVKQIEVASGPAGSVIDVNGKLWVVCAGFYNATEGQLVRINTSTLEVEETITISEGKPGTDIALSADKQSLYYTIGTSVYKIAVTASAEADNSLFDASEVSSLYSFDVDPNTGSIWIGDGVDFSAPGKVYIYTAAGALSSSFDAGVSPGQVVFK